MGLECGRGNRTSMLSRRYDRRTLLSSAAVAATALGATVDTVNAARGWCRSDPVVLIAGVLVDIFCTAPLSALLNVTGPTDITVTVPDGAKASLILAGLGFGRGEKVHFATSNELTKSDDHVDVKIEVLVPAKDDLPIGVEFAPRIIGILNPERAEGFANSAITLTTALDPGLGILVLSERHKRRKSSKRHHRR
jgi:hypothetical protein